MHVSDLIFPALLSFMAILNITSVKEFVIVSIL